MGYLIGGSATYSTWGIARTPIGIQNDYDGGTVKSGDQAVHSFEYTKGFKALQGGLFRYDPIYAGTPNTGLPRFVYFDGGFDPVTGDPNPSYFYLASPPSPYPIPSLMEYELDGLTGATVTFSGGTFTLNPTAWAIGPGQLVDPDLGDIIDVSVCTVFA
jgi:hypothetical protein